MTAEIVVMNRAAVAMAADSAATVGFRQGQKIWDTVNKLFSLSKYSPVGVMIYGNATWMGIPWETVVKSYRRQLGHRTFPKLQYYVDDFIAYLDNNHRLVPPEEQEKAFLVSVQNHFSWVVDSIRNRAKQETGSRSPDSPDEVARIVNETVDRICQEREAAPKLAHLPADFPDRLFEAFGEKIRQILPRVFQELPLDSDREMKLLILAIQTFTRGRFFDNHTGLVFAGFGEDELFPSVRPILVEGLLLDRLKFNRDQPVEISFQTGASILPFAQSDMVNLFVEGVDPEYSKFLEESLRTLFEKALPGLIPDPVPPELTAHRAEVESKLPAILEDLRQKLLQYRRQNNVNPVLEAVGILPKGDLAAMAETLVNLTSFKRRISSEPETVGGPIDVVVISKGDGFVWIRRKHYFEGGLNPHFFANYYRERDDQDAPVRRRKH